MKKTKKSKRPNRGWNQVFVWKKNPKVEPPKDSVYGCVMQALRKLKRGTVAEVETEAMKMGLAKVTKQNYRIQVQIKLRRLVRIGSAVKEKTAIKTKMKKATKKIETKKGTPSTVAKVTVKTKPKTKGKSDKPISDEELETIDSSIDEDDSSGDE